MCDNCQKVNKNGVEGSRGPMLERMNKSLKNLLLLADFQIKISSRDILSTPQICNDYATTFDPHEGAGITQTGYGLTA
jgi:hypothetical protein